MYTNRCLCLFERDVTEERFVSAVLPGPVVDELESESLSELSTFDDGTGASLVVGLSQVVIHT